MKSLDKFMDRQLTESYTCYDFVAEVWNYLFGEDIKEKIGRSIDAFGKGIHIPNSQKMERLHTPVSPCLVVMQRFKLTPHVGIYLGTRIFHLGADGVEYREVPLVTRSFHRIRYYR